MNNTFLNHPIHHIPLDRLEYNDDYLILSTSSITKTCKGWWAPTNHKSKKYLAQTGQVMRGIHHPDYTRQDHLRSRMLYKNLFSSITTHGMQAPLVTIRWRNPEDIEWTMPYNWGVWRDFWDTKPHGDYYRVIQGCNRLMVLRDMNVSTVPIIDITIESLKLHAQGICPTNAWVQSPNRAYMEQYSENVGFDWYRAHNELLY